MASHSNDDDLFEYEPEESTAKSTYSSIGNISSDNELINNIKSNLDIDIDPSGNLDSGKVQLALAYHMAYERFLEATSRDALSKGVHFVLDRMTNGDFPLLVLFYELEMKISKKMLLLNISKSNLIKDNDVAKDGQFISLISSALKIDFTFTYVNTCYASTWNITEHSLKLDRAVYLTLSKKLEIPVKQYLFDDSLSAKYDEHQVHTHHYKDEIVEKVNNVLIEAGLVEELSQIIGSPIKILLSNDE